MSVNEQKKDNVIRLICYNDLIRGHYIPGRRLNLVSHLYYLWVSGKTEFSEDADFDVGQDGRFYFYRSYPLRSILTTPDTYSEMFNDVYYSIHDKSKSDDVFEDQHNSFITIFQYT
jgi:hypothetical protein